MISKDTTFTLMEIAAASGVPVKTLASRARVLREKGVLPPTKGRVTSYFTYEQTIKLVAKPTQKKTVPRQAHIDLLRRNLQNDGYRINKGGKQDGKLPGD